ncbi:MAG: urease accessory protein UreD [Planctomycetes bacterium]|nr:urease accessory protein UreD [Planctomycetota bacterium]
MGEFPARIVAEDFVTPPEFAGWKLASEGSGRIGGARFTIAEHDGLSELAQVYEQVPIRVLALTLGVPEPSLIYLLNPTAGLMDGDAHGINVEIGPNTRSVITGQSATRIHPCSSRFSTQQWNLTIGESAIAVVLPGPAIPYVGSRYYQRVRIELAKTAHLIWGDIWFSGRYSRGDESERFQFASIIQDMQVRRQGQLVYRDRFHWQGPWSDQAARWSFGGHPAAGTIFSTSSPDPDMLPSVSGTTPFATPYGDSCWRFMGPTEQVIQGIVRHCLGVASSLQGRSTSEPWLTSTYNVAKTHWFETP